MNVLFLVNRKWPHIGGVEKHVREIETRIVNKGNKLTIISGEDIGYPKVKIFGLFYIWIWLCKNKKFFIEADIIHIHDVFVWYLLLRVVFYRKKVFTTFHGWEEIYPIPFSNIIQKKIANVLSCKSIAIGKYIEMYYKIQVNKILYGGIPNIRIFGMKKKGSYLYVGRLEENTGLGEFLKYLKNKKYKKVDFVGDGRMREECEKFGKVHGFTNPNRFYKKAETVVPSGYLTYLEAKAYKCKIKTFYSTPLKKDYWDEILKLKKFMTWDEVADEYLKLWKK